MSLAYSKCVFVPYPAKEIDWPSELLKLIIELSIKCLLPKSQAAPVSRICVRLLGEFILIMKLLQHKLTEVERNWAQA